MNLFVKNGGCEKCGGANYVGHPCRDGWGFLSAKAEAKLAEVIDASQELEVRGEQPEATMAPSLEIASSTEFDRFWKFAEEFAIDGAQRVGKWRVDEIATAYAAHVSRLSSEAIESASKEAVGRDLEPHFVAWAKRLAYLTMSDMNEPTSDPEFQQRVKSCDGELRMFLSAIEKARSK